MENNMKIYDAVRAVPQDAQKTIGAGRLKGMTDINPMWRIKTLTEQFGPCGFGWWYDIVDKWLDRAEGVQEVTANVMIHLFIKTEEGWSKPIIGVGGNKLVASERNGLYVSDECWKMALTDAISVACKALGMGADVYWQGDRTKYSSAPTEEKAQKKAEKEQQKAENEIKKIEQMKISELKVKALLARCNTDGLNPAKICSLYKVSSLADLTERKYADINLNWQKILEA
jgi:hypothetical protein